MLLKEWMVRSETWKDRFKNWTLTKGYNIAEGCARFSDNDTLKFISISIGSIAELQTQLVISEKLEYMENANELINKLEEVKRMLLGLTKYLKNKQI